MNIFSKEPQKAGAWALAFALLAFQAFGQEAATAGAQNAPSVQSNAAEQSAAPELVTDEASLPIGDAPASAAANDAAGPSTLGSLIRVVIVLALLCAGVWGIMVFLRKSTGMNVADDPYLKAVASLSLGQNRSAQILSVGSRAFLVGITDRAVNLIAELDDRELIDAMNLSADKTSSASVAGFQSILASFLPGSGKQKKNREPDSAPAFGAELIRRQRERLMNGSAPGSDTEGDNR